MVTALMFFTGLAILLFGAHILLKGAESLALSAGISKLVIGLTIVAAGTSAPELAVSAAGALSGQDGITVGNVIGSNICNILLILGGAALISPLTVKAQLRRFDVWVLLAYALAVGLMSLDGTLSFIDGVILLGSMVLYTAVAVKKGRADVQGIEETATTINKPKSSIVKNLLCVAFGLGLLVVGSQLFVGASVTIARMLGWSELVIGLTIVAIGTSAPEIATSFAGTLKGQKDLAIGNVIGSNIFNPGMILGVSCLLGGVDGVVVTRSLLAWDMLILIGISAMLVPMVITHGVVSRVEGGLLLLGYILYLAFSCIGASHEEAKVYFIPVWVAYFGLLGVMNLRSIGSHKAAAQS